MKKTGLTLLIFGAVTAVLFASIFVPYNNSKAPSLPLPVAYERAMAALGNTTNQFHCLSARVTTDYGADGEWQFAFCSTNSQPKHKWVTVQFNGKIHIEDILAR